MISGLAVWGQNVPIPDARFNVFCVARYDTNQDGDDDASRLTVIWPDDALMNGWLQVTVVAGEATGLTEEHIFYFGNAIGESGNSASDAKVNAFDMLSARDNQRNFLDPAPIDFFVDYNRDARVNATDMLIARNNQTHFLNALRLFTVPVGKAAGSTVARTVEDGVAELDWLFEYDPAGVRQEPDEEETSVVALSVAFG